MHVGDVVTTIFFFHARNFSILAEIFGSITRKYKNLGWMVAGRWWTIASGDGLIFFIASDM